MSICCHDSTIKYNSFENVKRWTFTCTVLMRIVRNLVSYQRDLHHYMYPSVTVRDHYYVISSSAEEIGINISQDVL